MILRFLNTFSAVAYPLLLAMMLTLMGFVFGVIAESAHHAAPMIHVPADEFMEMVKAAK